MIKNNTMHKPVTINTFYKKIHFHDVGFAKKHLESMPVYIQNILIAGYLKRQTRYDANSFLRTTVASLHELIPNILQSKFDAGEGDIKKIAKDAAARCKRFSSFWYVFNSSIHSCATEYDEQTKTYELCCNHVVSAGLNPPKVNQAQTIQAAIRRMSDEYWWLRKLRKLLKQSQEAVFIHLEKVNKFKGIYCSNFTANQRIHHKRMQELAMQCITATNENGDTFSLAELSEKNVSNPVNRRNELMTRIRGFENISKEMGHKSLFVTMTCPSKYHNAYAKTGQRNKSWAGLLPSQGQKYLCSVWARIRAELARKSIFIYGLRIAEPQHDGTPHWHLCLFLNESDLPNFKDIVSRYNLAEDGEELGASANRVDFIDIDPARGSASGYVAKYICKNIDGSHLQEGIYGEDPVETAQRVEAWASCWGIRQFQQIGGVSVTVWREIRRLSSQNINNTIVLDIFNAADKGDWAEYTKLMGGMFCKRNEQAIRPFYDYEIIHATGEIKSNWFDGIPVKKLKGIIVDTFEIVTRVHKWTITRLT